MADIDWEHEVNTWIRRADFDLVETEGDVVGRIPALVDVVVIGYRSAANDEQRTAAILLLPDRFETDYHPILRDYLSRVAPEAHTPQHRALVKALCILDGNWSGYDGYFDDLPGSIALGRERGSTPEQVQAIVPGVGYGDIQFGMSSETLIGMLGAPSYTDEYEDELDLEFEANGVEATFKGGAMITMTFDVTKFDAPVAVQHPTKKDQTLQTPVTEAELIERWGEPQNRARTTTLDGKKYIVLGYPGIAFRFRAMTRELSIISMSV